jgi:hypothetical protein
VTSVPGGSSQLAELNHLAERDTASASRSAALRTVLGDTPRKLKLLTSGLVALGLVLGLVCALGLLRDTSSVGNLGSRATEVSATSDLYYRLNDMDAQAADTLLVGYHPADPALVPASVDAAASDAAYERDRSAADADLGRIAQNPLLTARAGRLLDTLGGYEALIAQALYIDQNTQNEQPATPPAAASSLYTKASSMLHDSLLPAAQTITQADSDEVDGSYSSDHSAISAYGYTILGLALLVALALYLGIRYYARRFRRRLSLLSAAMVITLVLGIVGLATQLGTASDLHVAKQDAYDSIYALDRAQAVSDDANADESRWLLEGRPAALQGSFFQKAEEVGGVPGVTAAQAAADPSSYYSGLSQAVGRLTLDAAANSVSGSTLGGFLGSELHNVTFPGEAQAAYDAVRAFNAYLQDDQKIRQDVAAGDLSGAVAVDIGLQSGQSNYDFNHYMTALSAVVQVNTQNFDAAVAAGHGEAGSAAWAIVLLGELLLLACIGQAGYLRLREYR